jgi:hypothetical protein
MPPVAPAGGNGAMSLSPCGWAIILATKCPIFPPDRVGKIDYVNQASFLALSLLISLANPLFRFGNDSATVAITNTNHVKTLVSILFR